MDENWAAIVVSTLTGLFGLVSLIVTQFLAKNKSKAISPSPSEMAEAAMGAETTNRRAEADTLAYIRHELREHKVSSRDNFLDLKEDHQESRRVMREYFIRMEEILHKVREECAKDCDCHKHRSR